MFAETFGKKVGKPFVIGKFFRTVFYLLYMCYIRVCCRKFQEGEVENSFVSLFSSSMASLFFIEWDKFSFLFLFRQSVGLLRWAIKIFVFFLVFYFRSTLGSGLSLVHLICRFYIYIIFILLSIYLLIQSLAVVYYRIE